MARGPGQPTKLDDVMAERILKSIRAGLGRRCAAHLARIDTGTLQNWIKWGREGRPGYVKFFERVKEADAQAEADAVGRILAQTERWQASAWWLERTHRRRYRRPAQPVAVPENEDLTKAPEDALVASAEEWIAKHRKETSNA